MLTRSNEKEKGSETVKVNFKEISEALLWNWEANHDMYTKYLQDSYVEEGEAF